MEHDPCDIVYVDFTGVYAGAHRKLALDAARYVFEPGSRIHITGVEDSSDYHETDITFFLLWRGRPHTLCVFNDWWNVGVTLYDQNDAAVAEYLN